MSYVEYKLNLDVNYSGCRQTLNVTKGDVNARKIIITFTKSSEIIKLSQTDSTAIMRGLKSDKTIIYNTARINSEGQVEYDLGSQDVSAAGMVFYEVQIITAALGDEDPSVLYSSQFMMEVGSSLYDDGEVTSSNEFGELTNRLLAADKWFAEKTTIIDDMTNIETEVVNLAELTNVGLYPYFETEYMEVNFDFIKLVLPEIRYIEIYLSDTGTYEGEEASYTIVSPGTYVKDLRGSNYFKIKFQRKTQIPISIDLGTIQVFKLKTLANYINDNLVPKARKIAGIDLVNDITLSELSTKLSAGNGLFSMNAFLEKLIAVIEHRPDLIKKANVFKGECEPTTNMEGYEDVKTGDLYINTSHSLYVYVARITNSVSVEWIPIPSYHYLIAQYVNWDQLTKKLYDYVKKDQYAQPGSDNYGLVRLAGGPDTERGIPNQAATPENLKIILQDMGSWADDVMSETSNGIVKNKVIKQYVDAAVAAVNQFNILIVDELPEEDIDIHTIYFVAKTDTDIKDSYDEWIYLNDSWEHIGNTVINLNGYVQKSRTIAGLPLEGDITDVALSTTVLNVLETKTQHAFALAVIKAFALSISEGYASFVREEIFNNWIADMETVKANTNARHTHENKEMLDNLSTILSEYVKSSSMGLALETKANKSYGMNNANKVIATDMYGMITPGSAISDFATKEDVKNKSNKIINCAKGILINLKDSGDDTIESIEIKGSSTQEGTASVSEPVVIKSVGDGGSIKLTSCGKNLFDASIFADSKITVVDGVMTVNGTLAMPSDTMKPIPIPAGDFTASGGYKDSKLMHMFKYNNSFFNDSVFNGTFNQPYYYSNNVYLDAGTYNNVVYNPQIEVGSAKTEFESYRGKTVTIPLSEPLRGVGIYVDKITRLNGVYGILRNVGVIESYNNEDISTTYMSSTGTLSTGATVIFGLSESKFTAFDDDIQEQLNALESYYSVTNVFNSEDADMTVYYTADTKLYADSRGGGSSTDLSNYYTKSQTNTLITAVETTANRAEAIARGKATGYVFDTVDDMNTWLANSINIATLNLGDNLYIRATNVPDYWWDGSSVQQLETQKVDLSTYYTKTDTDTAISTAVSNSVGDINSVLATLVNVDVEVIE